ncbi:MAG: hypothetical protein HY791_13485 [Deltaproteobacteria bacterium]|nr:hypothetical protein [Deltaproteobacteria bacterium]
MALPDGVRVEMINEDDGTATLVLAAASVTRDTDLYLNAVFVGSPPLGCTSDLTNSCGMLTAGVGTLVIYGLCRGTWDFTGMGLYLSADQTCSGGQAATCTGVTGVNLGTSPTTIPVDCTSITAGAVTLDVTCTGPDC